MSQHPEVAAPVGLVAGTEDSTPLQFSVALAPEAYLRSTTWW